MNHRIRMSKEDCAACGLRYSTDPARLECSGDWRARVARRILGNKSGFFGGNKIGGIWSVAGACPAGVITVTDG